MSKLFIITFLNKKLQTKFVVVLKIIVIAKIDQATPKAENRKGLANDDTHWKR